MRGPFTSRWRAARLCGARADGKAKAMPLVRARRRALQNGLRTERGRSGGVPLERSLRGEMPRGEPVAIPVQRQRARCALSQ